MKAQSQWSGFNVPIIGQPQPDYALGLAFVIPNEDRIVQSLKDQVAALPQPKKARGEIAVILGSPPQMVRCFEYEEFLELVFGKPDAELATGGKINALETDAQKTQD